MDSLGLEFVGTERFKDGLMREYSYYAKPGIIEERTLHSHQDCYVVTRHIVDNPTTLKSFVTKAKELAASERKSKRGHDELMRIVNKCPSVTGYIDTAVIDKVDRKVIIAVGNNLPASIAHGDWSQVFRI